MEVSKFERLFGLWVGEGSFGGVWLSLAECVGEFLVWGSMMEDFCVDIGKEEADMRH